MKCPRCLAENLTDSGFCRACATPLPVPERDLIARTETFEITPELLPKGSLFAGRFQVIEELGRGGMGLVYRAYDRQIREEVALKLIKPEIASDAKALERFSNELKLARKIVHRNVCRMYEIMEYQGVRFISMEYVPGEDLKSFIKRARRLDIGAAVSIAVQLCEGLAEAHRMGVVHRDLKPGNVLIDKDGNAKIMDFGIARSFLEKGITGEGRMVGTPEYLSPEQIEGKGADPPSDLYALGVILFEMVCGTFPFEGDAVRIIAQKIQGKATPDPKTVNPHVPDDLDRVILKCLEKSTDRRYGTAVELLADLRKIEKDLPTSERILIKANSGIFAGFTRRLRTMKIPGRVIVPAVVALVAVFVLHPWRSGSKTPAVLSRPTLAVLFFANRTNDPGLDIWKRSLCTKLINSIRQLSNRPGPDGGNKIIVISESNIYSYLKKLGLENAEYSADDLDRITALSAATHILTGKLMEVGDNLQLYYELEGTARGATVASSHINGRMTDLDAMVTSLAGQVLGHLHVAATGRVRPTGSRSAVAEKLYAEASDLEIRASLSSEETEEDHMRSQSFLKLQAAIKADGRFAAAYWGLGDYYEHRFVDSRNPVDLALMKENYERAYHLDPQLAGANAGLGWVRYYEERLDEAYDFFRAAAQSEPENPRININVGSFLCSLGQIECGIRYFTKAIESGDTSVSPLGPYHLRARHHMNIGKLAEAADDARTMIALEPEDVSLRLFYARVLAKMNQIEEAERELSGAETIDPGNPDLLYIRAYLYSAAGNKEQALPILRQAGKENPFWFSYFLSENYSLLGLKEEALAVIREGVKNGYRHVFFYPYPYQVLISDSYKKLRSDTRFQDILMIQKEKDAAQRGKYRGLCES